MGSFSIWHWLIVLIIVMLIFGTNKLKNMGSDLGEAVKNFKDAMNNDNNMPNHDKISLGSISENELKK